MYAVTSSRRPRQPRPLRAILPRLLAGKPSAPAPHLRSKVYSMVAIGGLRNDHAGSGAPSEGGRLLGPEPRIEDVPQAVAEQVHAEHGQHDAEPWESRDPPRLPKVVTPLAQHAAPLGLRRLAPGAEKAERRRREDGGAEAERGRDHERGDDVGEDVADED